MNATAQKFFVNVAEVSGFVLRVFRGFGSKPEFRETLRQFYAVGNRSLFLITFTSFLVGIVFTKQSRPSLSSFGAESWLPALVSAAVATSGALLCDMLIPSRHEFGRAMNRFANARISAAATNVARHGGIDVAVFGIGIFCE